MFNLIFIAYAYVYSSIFIRKYFVIIIHIIFALKLTHWNKFKGLKHLKTQKKRKSTQWNTGARTRLAHTAVLWSHVGGWFAHGKRHGVPQAVAA